MNKRQKKKAYKKRYGHNPPTKDYLYKTYGLDTAGGGGREGGGLLKTFSAVKGGQKGGGKKN